MIRFFRPPEERDFVSAFLKNISKENPNQVTKMRAFYDQWWDELEPTFAQTTEIQLGHPKHPKVTMTAHDWLNTGPP